MRRNLLITTVTVALLFAGCSKKEIKKEEPTTASSKGIETGVETAVGEYRDNIDKYGGDANGYSYDSEYNSIDRNVQNIYFDVNRYIITPDKLSIVSGNAQILKKDVKQGAKIKIEGNCDATGTDEYNYALGLKRAKATKEALVTKGIEPSKIIVVSLGESSPECTTDSSDECYSKNRRVEFKVMQ